MSVHFKDGLMAERNEEFEFNTGNKRGSEILTAVKESNPKDSIGATKVPMTTLPFPVLAECSLGMLEGALKYRRHNYRVIGVRTSIYIDAAFRHLMAYWEGEDIDPESGLPHITKAMTSLMVLRDAQVRGKAVDDRPPGTTDFIKYLNTLVKGIVERYGDTKEPYTQLDGGPDEYQFL